MAVRSLFLCLLSSAPLLAEPIQLHPSNPHCFLFREKPTVLVTSAEHYGAVLNSDFDYRRYLDTLRADGMNYTRIFSGSYVEAPGAFGIRRNTLAPAAGKFLAPWLRSGTPGYGNGGNKFDLEQWNPAYFERLSGFVAEAEKRGIVVEMTLFSSQYGDQNWALSAFNPANNVNGTSAIDRRKVNTLDNGNILGYQERLVRKVVRELNAFDNVTYEIQNEPWSDRTVFTDTINPYLQEAARNEFPNSVDLADGESEAWQARVASWITEEEKQLPNRHLIAQNYCNFRYPVRELAPGVSIVNFHYAYPEAVSLNRGLGRMIAYDESGFIGREDATYRKQAWNFMLAGGGVFDSLDYSFTLGHEDGRDMAPNGPGGGSPALRRQLRVLSEFLHGLDLVNLRPDVRVVRRAPGVYTQALSVPGKEYAVYMMGSGPCRLVLDLPAGVYSAEWINPASGKVERTEKLQQQGGAVVVDSPVFDEDMVVRIRDVRRLMTR